MAHQAAQREGVLHDRLVGDRQVRVEVRRIPRVDGDAATGLLGARGDWRELGREGRAAEGEAAELQEIAPSHAHGDTTTWTRSSRQGGVTYRILDVAAGAPRAHDLIVAPERRALAADQIERAIVFVRGEKVMLDSDLAEIYGVPTKALVQAVKRNLARFPADFMFRLTLPEVINLRSHLVTSSLGGHGGRRYLSYAFTEQGVAMLSSVLRSERAIQVNIAIMRTFVRLRSILVSRPDLERKLDALERKYDAQFKVVFDAIRALMEPEPRRARRIGFHSDQP